MNHIKRIGNKIFLHVFCTKFGNVDWYMDDNLFYYEIIELSDEENKYADFKIRVFDGSNKVSEFTTNNLWSIN